MRRRFVPFDADEPHTVVLPIARDNPEEAASNREVAQQLHAVIATLSRDDQSVIGQFYFENKSIKEIARSLGIGEETAKVRLHRARKKLAMAYRDGACNLL